MGTVTRPELSKKNEYYMDRHRYYELKHFCLQYNSWKESLRALDGLSKTPDFKKLRIFSNNKADPTAKCAEAREYYIKRIKMVEETAKKTDSVLGDYILKAVTTGMSYEVLNAKEEMPCCKDVYYKMYRRFFWLLDFIRG